MSEPTKESTDKELSIDDLIELLRDQLNTWEEYGSSSIHKWTDRAEITSIVDQVRARDRDIAKRLINEVSARESFNNLKDQWENASASEGKLGKLILQDRKVVLEIDDLINVSHLAPTREINPNTDSKVSLSWQISRAVTVLHPKNWRHRKLKYHHPERGSDGQTSVVYT